MTLADLKSSGIVSVATDLLMMWLRGPQSVSSRVLRNLEYIEGQALWTGIHMFRWFNFSCASSSLKLNVLP